MKEETPKGEEYAGLGMIVYYKNDGGIIYPAITIKNNEDLTSDLQVFGHTIFLKLGVSKGKELCQYSLDYTWEDAEHAEIDKEAKEDGEI
jgi:hypothetical protein